MESNKHHFSTDAEQSVLGAMLLDPNRIGEILGTINAKHFYHRYHRVIFSAIRSLSESRAVIDLVTLNDHLECNGETDNTGGIAYLTDLAKNCPSAANVLAYCDIMIDRWVEKRTDDIKLEYDNSDDLPLSWLVEKLSELDRSKREDFAITWGSDGFDNEIDYLIDGVLPEESFGITYGPSESFKSFLAIDQACCISTGMPWDGHHTKRGLVVYVAGEGQTGVAKRIKAWEKETNTKSNVAVIGRPIYMNDDGQPQKVVKIVQSIEAERGEKVRMVVIDTLARCITGDENSAQDMGAFIKGCDYVKTETGVTVNVIHHSGKDKDKGARGSSALRGACDFEFRVGRPNADELAVIIKCTKMKDSERMKDCEFAMLECDLGITDRRGKKITSLSLARASVEPQQRAKKAKDRGKELNFVTGLVMSAVIARNKETGGPVERLLIRDDVLKVLTKDRKPETAKKAANRGILEAGQLELIVIGEDGRISPTEQGWLLK